MAESEPTLLQSLRTHRSDINCADFCGSSQLATASSDKTVRIWRWAPGLGFVEAEHSPVRGHKYGVVCVRFSPQGTMLASCSIDGTTRVCCSRDAHATHQLLQPGGHGVRSCRFSADSRHLLTGADDGSVCIWDLLQKHLVRRVAGHEGAVQALCVCADGALLYTSCTLGVVKLYSMRELLEGEEGAVGAGGAGGPECGELAARSDAHDLGVLSVDAAPGASDLARDEGVGEAGWRACRVASGGQDCRVKLWSAEWRAGVKGDAGTTVARLGLLRTLEGHTSAVTCVRWSDNGTFLASASVDKTVRLWLPDVGRCARVLDAHARYVNTIAFSRHDALMVTGSNDKSVKVWALRDGLSLDAQLEPPCSVLSHFASGDLEGIGPAEGALAALGGARGEPTRLCSDRESHAGAVNGVAFSGDHTVATACSDKLVRVFRWSDLEAQLELARAPLAAHRYPVTAVDWHAAGGALLSASLDGTAVVWDVETGCRLCTLSVESAGGAGGEGGAGGGGARDARVSPHRADSLLLVAGDDHVAPLWRLGERSAEPIHVYRGHTDAVSCCAWAPDGTLLATGSHNGDFRLYRAPPAAPASRSAAPLAPLTPSDTRQLYAQDDAHDLGVQSCDFSPTASAVSSEPGALLLATAGNDSLAKLWLVTVDAGLEQASVRLLRKLVGHGGNVMCVRFSPSGDLVATAATDKHARVWWCRSGRCAAAVAHSASAVSCALSPARLLAVGCLDGELALWRLPPPAMEEEGAWCGAGRGALRGWGLAEVASWLVEHVLRAPEFGGTTPEGSAELLSRVKERAIDGARIATAALPDLLEDFHCGDDNAESPLFRLLSEELDWLQACERAGPGAATRRRDEEAAPPPPHHYLCPVTHHLMLDPVKCADGFTYERAAILECFLAAGKLVSPMTNQPLLNAELSPNYELKRAVRRYLLRRRSVGGGGE